MEDWQEAGSRIKADWVAMLEAMRTRSEEKVKLPFVPLRVSGGALRAVLEDLLPIVLGDNPSLLTVISEKGTAVKAYAEDASGGVYEKLQELDIGPDVSRGELLDIAGKLGVEVGVTKVADTRFFELFKEEPDELLEAVCLLAGKGAEALRRGWLSFEPRIPAAELAKSLRLEAETMRLVARALLPEGRYGLGMQCTGGPAALVLEVGGGNWTAGEARVGRGSVTSLVRELLDDHNCDIALAFRLPDVASLVRGSAALAEFLRSRGEAWDVRTRSGLEGVLAALPWLVELAGIKSDLQECNINLESVLSLLRSYLDSAKRHARREGVHIRLSTEGNEFHLTWDAEGLGEKAGPDPIALDLAAVRHAVAVLASDPLVKLRGLVPHEVMDQASYKTVAVLLECDRPKGRLILFGGPHHFFDHSWKGDACGIFMDAYGRPKTADFPSNPLLIEENGGQLSFEAEGLCLSLRFEETTSRSDIHGPGKYLRGTRLAEWLPGLDVRRSLHRFVSGRAELGGLSISVDRGWMYLEQGAGLLLRWPFGATWHYTSFLGPDGECGSGVRAAPMLGASTPEWWRKLTERTVDGGVRMSPGSSEQVEFTPAFDPGPPPRIARAAAAWAGQDLRFSVVSAIVAPFDEDGQVIFRLRCLCGEGIGLVELPASLPGPGLESGAGRKRPGLESGAGRKQPGLESGAGRKRPGRGARRCEVSFTDEAISFRAAGREILAVETGGSSFLRPHEAGSPGLLRRAEQWLDRMLLRSP